MASTALAVEVPVTLVVNDRTRAALIEMGWTPPPDDGCSCDKADDCDLLRYPGHERPHRYMQGRLDPACPEHGDKDGSAGD